MTLDTRLAELAAIPDGYSDEPHVYHANLQVAALAKAVLEYRSYPWAEGESRWDTMTAQIDAALSQALGGGGEDANSTASGPQRSET
jgi:hypothetical protein